MVGLGNIPIQKDDKDRRATSRNSAFIKARESLEGWRQIKDAPETYKSVMKTQIMITAVAEGFFFCLDDSFCGRTTDFAGIDRKFSGY